MKTKAPLRFNANTAKEGVLRTVPDISDDEVTAWISEHAKKPFSGADDFRAL